MERLFAFRSIRSKVLFGFSIVLIIICMMSIINILGIQRITGSSENITKKELPLLISDEKLSYNMLELESAARGYFLLDDNEKKEEFFIIMDEGEEIEKEMMALTDVTEVKEIIKRKNDWEDNLEDAINQYDLGHKKQAIDMLTSNLDTYEELQDEVNALTKNREENMMQSGEDAHHFAKATVIFVIIVAIVVILVGIGVAILTSKSIRKSDTLVMERMNEVAEGRLDLPPLKIETSDETAQLTEATNRMSANNRNLLQRIREVAETVSSQSEELTQSANEVKAGTQQAATTMQEL